MLVLSRQRDEFIMIGDDIEVAVVDIRGDKVRLGINAPKSVSVHRKEVYDRISEENRAAAPPQDQGAVVRSEPSSAAKILAELRLLLKTTQTQVDAEYAAPCRSAADVAMSVYVIFDTLVERVEGLQGELELLQAAAAQEVGG